MYKQGAVERIAGPVVVAKNMQGAQMYELVKVGETGLIGEIIRVEEDKATIQVYEETIGMKPGEKVERTGKPLSVELGPGVISQIYDGIQRPLPVLRETVGAFVRRGVTAPAVDRKKKWHFTPKVKQGEKVTGGDVLGTVPETVLVTHRVLVPPELTGKIKSIVSEGEYTVTDDIAELERGGETVKLQLMHTWPVRRARPFKRKVPADTPLITGQRIMDFFFPLAKGGTAAIPGGFGTGKCVAPDTPVLLADGRIVAIEELFDECQLNGKVFMNDGGLEHIAVSESMPKIVTLPNQAFTYATPSLLYTSVAPRTVEIETRTGRKIKTTLEHKFRVLQPDLTIRLKAAGEVAKGDRILAPRRVYIKGRRAAVDILGLVSEDDLKALFLADRKARHTVASLLVKHRGRYPELAAKLGTNSQKLARYAKEKDSPSLYFVKRLLEFNGINTKRFRIRKIKGKTTSCAVNVPERMNPQFAELLGLFITDGTLRPTYVGFRNHDSVVLARFKELAETIFKTRGFVCHDGLEYRISNTALVRFVGALTKHRIGEPKFKTIGVPLLVQAGDNGIVSAFLRGVFHGDGAAVQKQELYIVTDSESFATQLTYLLLRLGIFFILERRRRGSKIGYRVVVRGKRNLATFFNTIRPLSRAHRTIVSKRNFKKISYAKDNYVDLIPIKPSLLTQLSSASKCLPSRLDKDGVHLYDYSQVSRIPLTKLARLVKTLRTKSSHEIVRRAKSLCKMGENLIFDEIKSTTLHERPSPVYDFTVPVTHNFVAGQGGLVASNTVMQHQLAKWADAEVIVYVGCGERGNEMAEVLEAFPKLQDPRTGQPLMSRTTLVANTSNMPIAAREASVYTGITIAEYFRDMGYDVALMADSTSRWAEALREISGRLEEMPGEEGYPAYLASKLAEFYERAGRIEVLGSESKLGSISVCGAVSPPGADFSEPVTQNTLRIVKVFWALDTALAQRRHFPAISWLTSYSLYLDSLEDWFKKEGGSEWIDLRREAMYLLQRDEELREIVMLVGPDALSESQRVILEAARMIKEDFLMQSAVHPVDSYCSTMKTFNMIKLIIKFHDRMKTAVERGVPLPRILELPVKEDIARMKIHPPKEFDKTAEDTSAKIDSQFNQLVTEFLGAGGE